MGYRSDVCVGMTDEATRLFQTLLEHLPKDHEAVSLVKDARTAHRSHPLGDEHKSPDANCDEKFFWEYVKWYDTYECVGFIESFLTDCIPEEDYKFVRLGEESDDVEERGEYWDAEIYIARSISW